MINESTQSDIIRIQIDGMRLKTCKNNREHWRVVWMRTKDQRAITRGVLNAHKPPQKLPLTIRIHYVHPNTSDGDNLIIACAAIRDGVADWLGVNDRSPDLHWEYTQSKLGPGVYCVAIEIEEET